METVLVENVPNVHESFIWFIPLIVVAIYAISKISEEFWGGKNKIGMAVLGMQQSGKTLWWNALTGQERGGQTTEEEIESFTLHCREERELHLRKSIDIGGMEEKMVKYRELVEENDKILFFFNIKEYLENTMYKRYVLSRLDLITTYLTIEKNIYVIFSYLDKLSDSDKDFDTISDEIQNKFKGENIRMKCHGVNMTNPQDVELLKMKIFNPKN